MSKNLVNIGIMQLGWWSITLTHQNPIIFIVIVSFLLSVHLVYCSSNIKKEASFILLATALGSIFDWLAIKADLFTPINDYSIFPLWLICYWLVFATSFSFSLAWLGQKWWGLISVLGFLMAPLTYYAGEKFGLLTFNEGLGLLAYVYYGLFWAVSYPILFIVHKKLSPQSL